MIVMQDLFKNLNTYGWIMLCIGIVWSQGHRVYIEQWLHTSIYSYGEKQSSEEWHSEIPF